MAYGVGDGTTLEVSENDGTSYTTIGCVVNSISTEASRESVESTCLSDTYRTFLASDIDAGELGFEILLDNAEAVNQQLNDLFIAGTTVKWRITYSNDGTNMDEFDGFLTSNGRSIERRSMLVKPLTVKLTGNPGLKGA